MKSTKQDQIIQERFIFLASPIAWSIYFIVVYLLVEAACGIGLLRSVVEAVALILMLPTLAIIVYAGWRSRGVQERAAHMKTDPASEVDPAHMQHFLGQIGIWLSGLFVLLTIAVGVAAWVLSPC